MVCVHNGGWHAALLNRPRELFSAAPGAGRPRPRVLMGRGWVPGRRRRPPPGRPALGPASSRTEIHIQTFPSRRKRGKNGIVSGGALPEKRNGAGRVSFRSRNATRERLFPRIAPANSRVGIPARHRCVAPGQIAYPARRSTRLLIAPALRCTRLARLLDDAAVSRSDVSSAGRLLAESGALSQPGSGGVAWRGAARPSHPFPLDGAVGACRGVPRRADGVCTANSVAGVLTRLWPCRCAAAPAVHPLQLHPRLHELRCSGGPVRSISRRRSTTSRRIPCVQH